MALALRCLDSVLGTTLSFAVLKLRPMLYGRSEGQAT
jgi:hypothetical protein